MADNGSQTGQSHSLNDMPLAWLASLVTALDAEAGTCMRTCTALRDLVLAQNPVRVQFDLPILPRTAAACQADLQLACKYAASIELVLRLGNILMINPQTMELPDYNPDASLATDINASASSLLLGAMTAAGQGLAGIQSVVLQNLYLDCVVPPWLIDTCPHMTNLHLSTCKIVSLPDGSIPTCGQLKHLSITLDDQTVISKRLLPHWERQWCALPALQSLTLQPLPGLEDLTVPPAFLEQCGPAIGSQLTKLTFASDFLPGGQLGVSLVQMFPNVSSLSMPGTCLNDEEMEAVFSMHSLRQLTAVFHLEQSYTHRTCPWVQLSLPLLDIASLARLPLQGVQSFHASSTPEYDECLVSPSGDLEENRRVVAAMRPRLRWGPMDEACLGLHCLDASGAHASPACIAAVLPLLPTSNVMTITISAADQVTPELVAALGQYMTTATPSNVHWDSCSFTPGACSLLLSSLPPSAQRTVFEGYSSDGFGVTEAHLTAICSGACHSPITVVVNYDVSREWQYRWMDRVQGVMEELGQHHVNLTRSWMQ